MSLLFLLVSVVTWAGAFVYGYVWKKRGEVYKTQVKVMNEAWHHASFAISMFAVREAIRSKMPWTQEDEESLLSHIRRLETKGLEIAPLKEFLQKYPDLQKPEMLH